VEALDHEVLVVVGMDDGLPVFVPLKYDVLHGWDRLCYENGVMIGRGFEDILVLNPILFAFGGRVRWGEDRLLRRYVGRGGW
jgi:hypothetical protein